MSINTHLSSYSCPMCLLGLYAFSVSQQDTMVNQVAERNVQLEMDISWEDQVSLLITSGYLPVQHSVWLTLPRMYLVITSSCSIQIELGSKNTAIASAVNLTS